MFDETFVCTERLLYELHSSWLTKAAFLRNRSFALVYRHVQPHFMVMIMSCRVSMCGFVAVTVSRHCPSPDAHQLQADSE